MIPINQTRLGYESGNCFAACIATLLELPISSVDFVPVDGTWLEKTQEMLGKFGLMYLGINVSAGHCILATPETHCIFVGNTGRGTMLHAVVGRLTCNPEGTQVKYTTVHDPHPSRAGLEGPPVEIGFIVPINAAALIKIPKFRYEATSH